LVKKHIPERGDIVWLTFDPQAGDEQAARRTAVVLSKLVYSAKRGLMIACPITSQNKGYPLEVPIDVKKRASVVLPDHIRSVDLKIRLLGMKPSVWRRIEIASDTQLSDVSRALLTAMGW
jgi:mRNA interferase MazF